MATYVVLVRGINVGGKNKLSMKALKSFLEELGYSGVSTLLASGNIILNSSRRSADIKAEIEKALPSKFKLDSELIKVLALTKAQFKAVVANRPKGFGDQPGKYHSDAIFLMDVTAADAMEVFDPREGIDAVWPGTGVIYSQRLTSQRTKSRLSKIVGTPAYKEMTIRSWATTTKLLDLLEK